MERVDIHPTHTYENFKLRRGRPFPFGATLVPGGVNFSIFSSHAISCNLVLFKKHAPEPMAEIPFPDEFRIGNVYSMIVFELDFEENLKIIRQCVKYKKRVIFPSTSEVYGMSPDQEFDEENSPLMLGPINKERWIYSCAKQMLDRVIYAYGAHEGLKFTLFRPFNWIGPKLDSIHTAKEGSSRVLTQFLYNILAGEPIQLVDGGNQRRSFTFIEDGIDALMKIIENKNGCADGRIFNIGNPNNDLSVRELAEKLRAMVAEFPLYREKAEKCRIVETSSDTFYGKGYQDMLTRVPSVKRAKECLGWEPTTTVDDALRKTLEFYLVDEREKLSEFL